MNIQDTKPIKSSSQSYFPLYCPLPLQQCSSVCPRRVFKRDGKSLA